MREILFRGKAKDGKWYFGDLVQFKSGLVYIQSKEENASNYVIPETVGQFTGLTGNNGKKIFEGDIVKDEYGRIMKVIFREYFAKFAFILIKITGEKWTDNFLYADMGDWFLYTKNRPEVIGNIHDNPELLEVNK